MLRENFFRGVASPPDFGSTRRELFQSLSGEAVPQGLTACRMVLSCACCARERRVRARRAAGMCG